jgi:hypothetical protein
MSVEKIVDYATLPKWQQRTLYKEAETQWLPSKCGTLRVGTLEYFRTNYQDEIADSEEGKPNFTINALGSWQEVSSWLNNSSYGVFYAYFIDQICPTHWPENWPENEFCDFQPVDLSLDHEGLPGTATFKFRVIKYSGQDLVFAVFVTSYSAHNTLIYCLKRTGPTEGTLNGYDACWMISASKVEEFANNMAAAILSPNCPFQIRRTDNQEVCLTNDLGRWTIGELGEISIDEEGNYLLYKIRDVIYAASKETVQLSINYPWAWSKGLIFNAPFFKGPGFEQQAETRIVFYLVKREKGMLVGLNPVCQTVTFPIPKEMSDQIEEQA